MTSPGNNLSTIQHVVVLMLENRSFDHMLGFLYAAQGNVSPAGQPFDGLDRNGVQSRTPPAHPVTVFQIEPTHAECLLHARAPTPARATWPPTTSCSAARDAPPLVRDGARHAGLREGLRLHPRLAVDTTSGWSIESGTSASDIMGCFTPEALPVLSALARGYAVCDHWYASVPTETLPNRAFACAATSQGHMDDKTHTFTCPSIFGLLGHHQLGWSIYGYDSEPLTKSDFTDITDARTPATSGMFTDFQAAAAAGGTLPAYTFLEPSWGSTGNSQHPNYDVALGEQLIHDVYEALRSGPGWAQTLLIITYDEHGGCYDHVPPPSGATPPDNDAGEFGFDFTRFGVRVPDRAGLAAHRGRDGVPGARGEHAARPHLDPQDRASCAGACPRSPPGTRPRPDSATCSRLTTAAHRRRAGRGDRAHGRRRRAGRRRSPSHLQEVQAELISRQFPAGRLPGRRCTPSQ